MGYVSHTNEIVLWYMGKYQAGINIGIERCETMSSVGYFIPVYKYFINIRVGVILDAHTILVLMYLQTRVFSLCNFCVLLILG